MKYIDIVKEAEHSGKFDNKKMWESVESVSELMEDLEVSHPQLYWKFLRQQVGIMTGMHYNQKFAEYDVAKMTWTDKDNHEHKGGYWTCNEVVDATKGMSFPNSVTDWDKYVAFNASATDLYGELPVEQILKVAYKEWFCDEDWDSESKDKYSPTKIWEYMCCKHSRNT
jgi:hypothetical protein